MPWVGLQCVIVPFPVHTHFLMECPCADPESFVRVGRNLTYFFVLFVLVGEGR